MESNTEKNTLTNLQNRTKNEAKRLSQYWKNTNFDRITNIISHFGGTNNNFADCIARPKHFLVWRFAH